MKTSFTSTCRATLLSGSILAIAISAGLAQAGDDHRDHGHFHLDPGSLVVSSSTYDPTQGALRTLATGTTLPNSATATTQAISNNNYVTVWNNESVDASFGATSAIDISDVDGYSGRVLHQTQVPSDQVVTSFPSKSEIGLHIAHDWRGPHVTFMGYASAGVGALDVSNSDAAVGQDPSNPVTFAYGTGYSFARTIVNMDQDGHFSYTPTINYGGNNGRSALLAPNGLYYMVGNSNNGNASTFGAGNGTNPDVTQTTGVEAVQPIDARHSNVTIPTGNSAEVDPLLQYTLGSKPDKPGKDNNYRGITEYHGALYFTKGSGSNGMDTVYTVSSLPTLANASAATISVVPGFPTDSSKATGGNFTPFAVFFANPTTMYVTDEGTGNTTDATTHAGLEKWSLVSGTWQLDYVLTQGLIGSVDSGLTGSDGPWPNVTSIGLRNLTGRVNRDGTVTVWATTSTASASGDNGADPNKVVRITDQLSATTLTGAAAQESFTTLIGPTYGKVYRGVAHVDD